MATTVKSKKGLLNLYSKSSAEVRRHFEHLPTLVEDYPMEVAIGYAFHRLELGQCMSLYCGVINIHCADPTVAMNTVRVQHMTREGFEKLYKAVFDITLPAGAVSEVKSAEKTRDTIFHGRTASEDELRNAIGRVLEYAESVNAQLDKKWKMKPFRGDWRGFSWKKQKLDARTTRYMLKGMGFGVS